VEKSLESKTLGELRALARAAGLRGYSDLRKKQLIELLDKYKTRPSETAPARASKPKKSAKSKSTPANDAASGKKPPRIPESDLARGISVEERIESAKYEMTLPGIRFAQPLMSTLHEDIDRLPASNESMLCLLPQRPGVVHAYWVLQPGASNKNLKLRLCSVGGDAIDIVEEIELPSERGHWYFHIPEQSEPTSFIAHLGYYDAAGKFHTAIQRGIARIPTLRASKRTDRTWWISEDEFRAMYLRAGGVIRDQRLAWSAAATSSPINAPSSRQK
jgi:hypothetical protein